MYIIYPHSQPFTCGGDWYLGGSKHLILVCSWIGRQLFWKSRGLIAFSMSWGLKWSCATFWCLPWQVAVLPKRSNTKRRLCLPNLVGTTWKHPFLGRHTLIVSLVACQAFEPSHGVASCVRSLSNNHPFWSTINIICIPSQLV